MIQQQHEQNYGGSFGAVEVTYTDSQLPYNQNRQTETANLGNGFQSPVTFGPGGKPGSALHRIRASQEMEREIVERSPPSDLDDGDISEGGTTGKDADHTERRVNQPTAGHSKREFPSPNVNFMPKNQQKGNPPNVQMFNESSIHQDPLEDLNSDTVPIGSLFDPKSQEAQGYDKRVYKTLYRKVMKEQNSLERLKLQSGEKSAFEDYQNQWNKYQDKNDKGYQQHLAKKNQAQSSRFQVYEEVRQNNMNVKMENKRRRENNKDLIQCSFRPLISPRSNNLSPKSASSQRSFYEKSQDYLRKKENWRNDVLDRQEKEKQQLMKSKFMSKRSQNIWETSSRGANSYGSRLSSRGSQSGAEIDNMANQQPKTSTNQSHKQSFLSRNFYNVDEQRQFDRQRIEDDILSQEREGRSKASAQYRTLSQNSGRSTGQSTGQWDQPYRPTISAKSKILSKKKRSPRGRLNSLHKEKDQFKENVQKKKLEEERARASEIKAQVKKNVNVVSDQKLILRFSEEFNQAFQNQLDQGPQLYIMDLMEDLKFIDAVYMQRNFSYIEELLAKFKINLILELEPHNIDDIRDNLFKICCAIQNLKINRLSPENPQLADMILQPHLKSVTVSTNISANATAQMTLIEQLTFVRNIINRDSFNLSELQIKQVFLKFQTMNANRKEKVYMLQKQNRLKDLYQKEQDKLQDKPFVPGLDERNYKMNKVGWTEPRKKRDAESASKSPVTSRSANRTDQLYNHAKLSQQYKAKLKEWYDQQQDNDSMPFNPNLNQNSLRIAQDQAYSQKSLLQKTYDYQNVARQDRDPQQREYEEQYEECTFKPDLRVTAGYEPYQRTGPPGQAQLPGTFNRQNSPGMKVRKSKSQRKQTKQENGSPAAVVEQPKRDIVRKTRQDRIKPIQQVQIQSARISQKPAEELPRTIGDYLELGQINSANKYLSRLPTVEEPICVLKIELDGQNIEEIKVFENDDPGKIVEDFGKQFNLSDNAKLRLLAQINEQIQMDDDSDGYY